MVPDLKPTIFVAPISQPGSLDRCAGSSSCQQQKNTPEKYEVPRQTANSAVSEVYRREIPIKPKIGVENEWAAVAIRQDELHKIEKMKELEAERAKKELYR